MELLESSLSSLVAAGEAGRKSADGMLVPLNGAISSITGAASELESIPFLPPELGARRAAWCAASAWRKPVSGK